MYLTNSSFLESMSFKMEYNMAEVLLRREIVIFKEIHLFYLDSIVRYFL